MPSPSQTVYNLCKAGDWDRATSYLRKEFGISPRLSTVAEDNYKLLGEVLYIHLMLKQSMHSSVLERAEKLDAIISHKESHTNKMGISVALLSIYWRVKRTAGYEGLLSRCQELLSEFSEKEEREYYDWISWYYTMGGVYYWLHGRLEESITYHQRCIAISKKYDDLYGLTRGRNDLGLVWLYKGKFQKAIQCYESNISNLERNDPDLYVHKVILNTAFGNLGILYGKLGDHHKALNYFHRSIELTEEIGDTGALTNLYHNMGSAYLGIGDYKTAEKYYNQSLSMAREKDDPRAISANLASVGYLHYKQGKYSTAVDYYIEAMSSAEEIGDHIRQATITSSMGILFILQGDISRALSSLNRAISLARSEGGVSDPLIYSSALYYVGYIHLLKGELSKTESMWQEVFETYRELGNTSLIASLLSHLIPFYSEEIPDLEKRSELVNYLSTLRTDHDSPVTEFVYSYIDGYLQKEVGQYDEALVIFEELTSIEDFSGTDFNLYVSALYTLCEVYLLKLLEVEDEDLLQNAISATDQLIDILKDRNMIPAMVDAYILKSKLSLIGSDPVTCRDVLDYANRLSVDYSLPYLGEKVELEFDLIASGKWLQNSSLSDRVTYSNIIAFLRDKGGSRGSIPDF